MASNSNNSMMAGSEEENLEEKLRSLLGQLRTECGILERIVYKNKNQHRRCSYFQYLLKVRRDLKLLQSANLRDILSSCFHVISGKKAKQKVHLLESLKRRKFEVGKYNFLERLLGIARLLSQMVEPMLKAATEISVLLAQSFFMGFSLTILALLGRIRVLVQQILLDVVSVFNTVSSISRSKQSVKITEGGLEIFREVFPTKEEFIVLECVWKSDKFVLVERAQNSSDFASRDLHLEEQTLLKASSSVQYLSIESFLGDDETTSEVAKENQTTEKGPTHIEDTTMTDLLRGSSNIRDDDGVVVEGCPEEQDTLTVAETPMKEPQSGLFQCSSVSPNTSNPKPKSESRKVAFLAVKSPVPSTLSVTGINVNETESKSSNKEDSFFSLLAAGGTKESLF